MDDEIARLQWEIIEVGREGGGAGQYDTTRYDTMRDAILITCAQQFNLLHGTNS